MKKDFVFYRNMLGTVHQRTKKENVTKEDTLSPHTIEQLYTAVKKKEEVCEPKDKEETPPIPPHTVEELYAAVQKKPKL